MSSLVASSNPAREFLLKKILTNIFAQFSRLLRNEKGEYYFIVHSDVFYTAFFSYKTCTLDFYTKYGRKSAESCVSLKGNDKAIFNSSKCYKGYGGSKKGRWLIKTYR